METLEPGKQACPAHYHMLEEEHLLMLEGAHALINQGTAPCRYLLIGERNPSDVIVYPDSGRVGVRLTGEGYRKSATMEYWDGQPT
jgi:uncharacterized cupin superfamily protein